MLRILKLLISILFLATLFSCVTSEPEFTYFGNMGPDHWSKYFKKCSGKHQSPININDVDVVNRTYSRILYKKFQKTPLATSIFNNGHTMLVKMTFVDGVPTISNGPLEGKGTYQFQQLHFHWGEDNSVGSEDRINNVSYPMELHVVFRNNKYESFEEATTKFDGIAVLAAFYEVVNYTNKEYDLLTSHLEHIHEPHTNVTLSTPLDLFSLLCTDWNKYYTYIGSLTTPPCSEDVVWIDFINPIGIPSEMIERFRYLKTSDGSPLRHNIRPVQPLNNRKVYRSVPENNHGSMDNNASANLFKNPLSGLIQVFSVLVMILNLL